MVPATTAIAKVGATPYVMFEEAVSGRVGGVFKKVFNFVQFNWEEFLEHDHCRSNIENTTMIIRTKFGNNRVSKTDVAGRKEVLAIILLQNLCRLISPMYELGIEPKLGLD